MSIFVAVLIGLYFLPQGQIGWLFVLGVLAGIGVAIVYLIPWSMLPDVIELDELETGERREGIFYGFFVFLQKLGLSLGVWVSGLVLEAAGYIRDVPGQPTPVQPPAVLQSLRLLIGPIPAVILLLSFIVVAFYPITREKHAEIRARLAARNTTSGVP
jgi:GPH family glycoside/pentoside/hexuronide:cation symporter